MEMKIVKKLLCVIFVLAILAGLAACGKGDDSSSKQSAGSGKSQKIQSGEDSRSDASGEAAASGGSTNASGENSVSNSSGTGTISKNNTSKTIRSGSTASSPPGANKTREQVIAGMPSKLKGTKIKYFVWENPKNKTTKAAIEGFEKATGITLEIVMANKKEYNAQLAARIAGGNSPDMGIMVYNTPDVVSNFQPITKNGFDFSDAAWDKELMQSFTFNGKLYGANLKNTPHRNLGIILYNKTALRRAEMEDPYAIWSKNPKNWTWDKLWSMCDEFLKANKNKEGYYGINFGIADGYARSFGASFFSYNTARGKFVNNVMSGETIKRYETLVDATKKKRAAPSDDGNGFVMGNILFAFSFSSIVGKENIYYSQIRKNLGCVPIPSDSTVQPLFEYCAFGTPVGAKNAEAVPYYIRYVMDSKGYDMNNYYMNAQAKNVVESMTARGSFYTGYGYTWEIWNELLAGTSAQVRTILEANNGKLQAQIDEYNAQIAKFAK